uniref:replication initiation protein RepM n=1 Tax=Psychrobacter sp. TaxID=56811 RepID=UPI001598E9AE|nr:replication initiation protein RepM [Psychrobacter sp.]QJS05569.1 replication protein, Rep3 superfamily [Psychrobacter sp.]
MARQQMVVKDNSMIGASYSLGVAEQRIIFLAIIEAREQDTLIKAGGLLRISALSYAKQFNVEKNTAYKVLREGADGLYEAEFNYSYADKETGKLFHARSRFVQKIAYADELGCIELVFAADVVPLITRLEERYTEYELKQVSGLQSEYAIRLYELLIQWRSVGKVPTMSLQELRDKLGVVEGNYKEMSDFKKRVLTLALTQINEHTDIIADYQQTKTGRKVTGFTFTLKQKPNAKPIAAEPVAADDNTFIKLTPEQITMFSSKLARLPELGDSAPPTAGYDEYAAIIADHLADKTNQAKYLPYLDKVGFKKPKPKAA